MPSRGRGGRNLKLCQISCHGSRPSDRPSDESVSEGARMRTDARRDAGRPGRPRPRRGLPRRRPVPRPGPAAGRGARRPPRRDRRLGVHPPRRRRRRRPATPGTFCSGKGILLMEIGADYDSPPTMMHTDPPDHTRYRKLVQPAFAPSVMRRLDEVIRARARAGGGRAARGRAGRRRGRAGRAVPAAGDQRPARHPRGRLAPVLRVVRGRHPGRHRLARRSASPS